MSNKKAKELSVQDPEFRKIWLGYLMETVKFGGGQKAQMVNFLLDSADKDNRIIMTMRQMAQKSNISLETVRLTVKMLLESKFMIRLTLTVYQINTDMSEIIKCEFKSKRKKGPKTELEKPKVEDEKLVQNERKPWRLDLNEKPEEGNKCPNCGAILLTKNGLHGKFLGCPNYKKCGFKGTSIR